MKGSWDKVLLFTFSIALICSLLAISLLHQSVSDQQWFILIWALAFGGAGFAAFLPGSIEWEVMPGLKAAGAFVVLLLVFWFGRGVKSVHGDIKDWVLAAPPIEQDLGPDITKAAVYVYLDDRMVKANVIPPAWMTARKPNADKNIKIVSGQGSIQVMMNGTEAGKKLTFLVQDGNDWWSYDVVVPPSFPAQLRRVDEETIKNRVQQGVQP